MKPKQHDFFAYKYSIEAGEISKIETLLKVLNKMEKKYKANEYDMLR